MLHEEKIYGVEPTIEDAKLNVGRWLESLGCRIYDEEGSELDTKWGKFSVYGIRRGKSPNLLVKGILYSKSREVGPAYIALTIKVGWEHQEIVQGFKEVLFYFKDYCSGAEYYANGELVPISAIVLATYYSPFGYIYRFEKGLPNNFVPGWPSSPLFFTLSRVMWAIRDQIREEIKQTAKQPLREVDKFVNQPVHKMLPMVGILAKNVREPNTLPYEAELLLSKPDWSWGIVGINE